MLVVTLDGTPLLGTRTGIGRYVHQLVLALPQVAAADGVEARFQVSTWSARGGRVQGLPAEVRQVGLRAPARLLRQAWQRGDHPTAESLGARGQVFHGTNFVAPPTSRARTVVTVHDLTYLEDSAGPANAAYRALVPAALRRGAHVVTPTHAVAEAVRDLYSLPEDRVGVTPLGVDEGWFTTAGPTSAWLGGRGLPEDYLLFVGSADPRKNLAGLDRAHRALTGDAADGPALVLAGPATAADLPDRPGLVRAGFLAEDDLRRLVAGCRALVLPSFDEGFGLPALEALAAGRPVVVSEAPALLEVTGPHAISAPAHDDDALADALGRALAAPDGAAERAARRDWARRWTWEACARATLACYARAQAA